jgi:hypothetical protein
MFTELSRSFVLGKPSQELVDALGVVLEAQQNIRSGCSNRVRAARTSSTRTKPSCAAG